MVLVDSGVWIDYFRGVHSAVTDRLHTLLSASQTIVGDLMVVEVLQGFATNREFDSALRLLSIPPQISIVDEDSAVAAARNYRALRARGITVRKTIDTLIATRCIADRMPLLYSDRDFDPFVAHLGLIPALDPP